MSFRPVATIIEAKPDVGGLRSWDALDGRGERPSISDYASASAKSCAMTARRHLRSARSVRLMPKAGTAQVQEHAHEHHHEYGEADDIHPTW